MQRFCTHQCRIPAWVVSHGEKSSNKDKWGKGWEWRKAGEIRSADKWIKKRKETLNHSLCVHVKSLQSCPTLCHSVDYSPPGSCVLGFSRQEYWSGLLCPPPGDLPNPGIEPAFPSLQVDSLLLSHYSGEGNGTCCRATKPCTTTTEPMCHNYWSLCSASTEASSVRIPCTATGRSPYSSQLETALPRQSGPRTAKHKSQHEVNRTLDFLVRVWKQATFFI